MSGHPAFEAIIDERVPEGLGGRMYGLYPALVTDVSDPDSQGRVKVVLPWAPDPSGGRYEAWARLATLMAGNGRGTWFIPDVNDEVLVGFEAGDPRRPYVLGALWNGSDAPPESMDGAGRNARKVIHSRNGVTLTLDDTDGQESLVLQTPAGQTVTLKDGPGSIEVKDANGNTVKLESSGITLTTSSKLSVSASTVEISAASKLSVTSGAVEFSASSFKVTSGTVELSAGSISASAGISKFAGLLRADAVMTNSVIGTTYTPGGGNTL
ncbi:phage baseplate assembly protein V [Archangium violaceum]|uniref:Type IV secretion protein Rhs n=1 Tax=Archangium violaceum Cb vi76 TaxID=1406225 RepID=A0A084T0U6_9BACT|nr:phage baseplate assembly protein V [Archangium violaceum]KFA94331.1 type IV secretion protein Rhs [Archangium violaceum Cb vi76]